MIVSRSKYFSLQYYLRFVTRRPVWVLIAVGLFSMVPAWHLPSLSFKTTVYDLIIDELPEANSYGKFKSVFGSDEIIRMVIEAEDVFDPATFAKVAQLSRSVSDIPGVRRVISLPEIQKAVDPRSEWSMEKFVAVLSPVDLFRKNLISDDHKTTIITLVLEADADKDQIVADAGKLIQESGRELSIYQIGMPLVSQALAQYTHDDFVQLTPIALVVIAILLLVLFRNLHCLLLPLTCVSLSLVWTFGFMAYAGLPVSMLTIIVPVFLIAVGTAYCLHICSEYLTQAKLGMSAKEASRATFTHMTFPVTLAVLTTIFGIGSLVTSQIDAIKEFAVMACFGIFSLLVIALTFFPAALALLPPAKPASNGNFFNLERRLDRLLGHVVELNSKHQKPCLIAVSMVMAVCVAGLFFIRVETNPVSYFKPSTSVSRNFHHIYQQMSGSFPMHVAMTGPAEDYFEDPANVAEIARLQDYLNALAGVDKTVSFADYLKLVNYATNRFDPQHFALPQERYEMRMLVNNFKSILGNDVLKGFMSPDMRQANILMLTHISSSRQFLDTKAAILGHTVAEHDAELSWEVTGLGMVIAASSHLITLGQVKSLSISLVLIFSVMVALFLSGKVGLIAVIPNLFPIVVNFGIMGLLGIPLSVATSLIASVAIGLAVDDTIHYLVRYNAEFKKDLDKDRAMRVTIMAVGRPIIFTSLTIGIGFSVLLFSHFEPTAIFGLLMIVTMVSALVGDLILLPTLMMHVELVTAWDLLKMMPSMGTMSPGMVHELNQPLNAIKLGNDVIRMILRKGGADQEKPLQAAVAEIGQQVTRASQIIERYSQSGKLPGFEKQRLQVNQPVQNTLELVEHQMKLDSIRLDVDLGDGLPFVMAHYNRMVQATYNLLTNAREAIEAKKTLHRASGENEITVRSFHDQRFVYVAIADTGIGMDAHHLDRVLEPFFTTKGIGQGKGLGLTICNQIVRDCGGKIFIHSASKAGTQVTMRFPMAGPQAQPSRGDSGHAVLAHGKKGGL